jgi:hypothetical protein
MRGEPSVEEWEQTLDADLLHHLIPAGQFPGMRRPPDVNELPAGAQAALADGIGRHGLEDLLIVPAAERTYGWQRRRWIYAPPCVLAWQASGTRRQFLVTGRAGRLSVRYDAASDTFMEAWTRRLRTAPTRSMSRAAPSPMPASGRARSCCAVRGWTFASISDPGRPSRLPQRGWGKCSTITVAGGG